MHSCQPSWNGRDSPRIWPYVLVVSWVAWFNSNVPESSSIAQMGVWLKHKLSILASFGPYISIFSGRGSWNLGGVAQIVGVATQKWAWSEIFHAHFACIILLCTLSQALFSKTWQLCWCTSFVGHHLATSVFTVVSRKYAPLFCMLASDKTGEGAYAWDRNIAEWRPLPTDDCHMNARFLYFYWPFDG